MKIFRLLRGLLTGRWGTIAAVGIFALAAAALELVPPFVIRDVIDKHLTTGRSAGLVALAPNGDFEIDDVLTPMPPDPCTNPVLLIVSAGGNWFAAGIPKLDK